CPIPRATRRIRRVVISHMWSRWVALVPPSAHIPRLRGQTGPLRSGMQVVTEVPARLAAAALALLVALALVVASPTSASAEDPPDYVVDTSQDENGSPDDCIDPGELKQCSLREAVRA